jgi:hypothetical protein
MAEVVGLVPIRKGGRSVHHTADDTPARLLLVVVVERHLHGHEDRV